ncbi:MAG: DUF4418 family protein [Clostridiales bacterium]|nr:DUF4418 family protein [Clostridiales bacterium]
MKKQRIPAILILIFAAVAAVGSQTFLSPCVHEDGTFGPCHWAGQMLLWEGLAAVCLAVVTFFAKHVRSGLYLGTVSVCILGILTPGVIIDMCRMSTMRCRAVMQPAMIILFSAALLCAVIGAIASAKE